MVVESQVLSLHFLLMQGFQVLSFFLCCAAAATIPPLACLAAAEDLSLPLEEEDGEEEE